MEEEKVRIILGIDVSTACLGVSFVRYDGENVDVLKISHVKPKISKKIKGTEALFMKAKQFKEEFIEKYKDFGITDIIIEEPLPNSQNNNTVTTLLRFNGMISQSIYEATGVVPKYISSYDARKFAFPELMAVRKYNKKGETYDIKKIERAIKNNELVLYGDYPFNCEKKYIVWNKISEKYTNIEWIYNKNDELATENFDASDSLVCVLGYINKEKYEDKTPEIIDYKKENININNKNITRFTYKVGFCGKILDKTIDL
jgi:Holliday junction resolvasome RuvABC endonuclease subunit